MTSLTIGHANWNPRPKYVSCSIVNLTPNLFYEITGVSTWLEQLSNEQTVYWGPYFVSQWDTLCMEWISRFQGCTLLYSRNFI